ARPDVPVSVRAGLATAARPAGRVGAPGAQAARGSDHPHALRDRARGLAHARGDRPAAPSVSRARAADRVVGALEDEAVGAVPRSARAVRRRGRGARLIALLPGANTPWCA